MMLRGTASLNHELRQMYHSAPWMQEQSPDSREAAEKRSEYAPRTPRMGGNPPLWRLFGPHWSLRGQVLQYL